MRTDQPSGFLNESELISRKEPLGGIAMPLVRDPARFTAQTVGGNEQGNRNLSFPKDRESIFHNALITIVKRDGDKASIATIASPGKIGVSPAPASGGKLVPGVSSGTYSTVIVSPVLAVPGKNESTLRFGCTAQ